jgi:hypothetical protein
MPNIPNTIITETATTYRIKPVDGYVLHNSARDYTDLNTETTEEVFYRGYGTSQSSVPLSYDFENTTIIDGYTAYGRLEIFARPRNEVPENQIFGGGGNNDHEVM